MKFSHSGSKFGPAAMAIRAVTRLPNTRTHRVIEHRRRQWWRRRCRSGSAVGTTIEVPKAPRGMGCGESQNSDFWCILSGLLFLQFSGPFCTQIMLIDDRPYTAGQRTRSQLQEPVASMWLRPCESSTKLKVHITQHRLRNQSIIYLVRITLKNNNTYM